MIHMGPSLGVRIFGCQSVGRVLIKKARASCWLVRSNVLGFYKNNIYINALSFIF
jgi:hypothetical protein